MSAVINILPVIVLILMVAIAIVLFVGIVTMGSNSARFPPRFRNKLMRARVALQGLVVIAILIMLASLYFAPNG